MFFLVIASTAGASTDAWSTHDAPILEVDNDGALVIPPRSLPHRDATSGLWLVLLL